MMNLTPREQQVASMLITGMSNRRIGIELGLTQRTIQVYATRIYRKAGIGGHIKGKRVKLMRQWRQE